MNLYRWRQLPAHSDRARKPSNHYFRRMPKTDSSFMRTLLAEFTVTFLFIFTICANGLNEGRLGVNTGSVSAGISTGLCSVALIYTFGPLSGAHFNPAVTVGAMVGGKMDVVSGLLYIIVQIAAACAAVGSLIGLFPGAANDTLTSLTLKVGDSATVAQAVGFEILMAFILVIVIYGTAMGLKVEESAQDTEISDISGEIAANKSRLNFAPIAIGFTLGFLCFLGGSVSGGAFNPARALAPALLSLTFGNVWIYLVGDCIGGALAAVLYMYVLRK